MSRGLIQQTYPSAGQVLSYQASTDRDHVVVQIGDETVELGLSNSGTVEGWCIWKGKKLPFAAGRVNGETHLWLDGDLFVFREVQRQRASNRIVNGETGQAGERNAAPQDDARRLTARIAGRVLTVSVKPDDVVSPGDEACVVEAMKMEHSIRFSSAGTVKAVHVSEGDQISTGDLLIELEPS